MELDKWPLIKLKLYLFSSANPEQRHVQLQLTVKEKKDESLRGPPTHTSGIITKNIPTAGRSILSSCVSALGRPIIPSRLYAMRMVSKPPCIKQEDPYLAVSEAMELSRQR